MLLCEKKIVIYDYFKDIVIVLKNDGEHVAKNVLQTSLSFTYISPVSYGILFIVTAIFSYFILNESMSLAQIIGSLMIIIGVVICTLVKK